MTDQRQPRPLDIKLRKRSRTLELHYPDDEHYELTAEYLRVYSPSAEVRGHGRGEDTLQTGKIEVGIDHIKPVGRYALQLIFDDGHDTGLYSWDYLYELCTQQKQRWQDYIDRLHAAGASRDPQVQVLHFKP
ncbi:MAG: DUF971 domain-containing protein [Pseudomonadota bacterium]